MFVPKAILPISARSGLTACHGPRRLKVEGDVLSISVHREKKKEEDTTEGGVK